MLDIDKIPTDVLVDLKKRGHSDARIAEMTPQEAFAEWCEWKGLSGWGNSLWSIVHELQEAQAIEEVAESLNTSGFVGKLQASMPYDRATQTPYVNAIGSDEAEAHSNLALIEIPEEILSRITLVKVEVSSSPDATTD